MNKKNVKPRQHSREVKLSKSLSWLLRHGAVKEGIQLDEGGYANVGSILKLKQFHGYTVDDISRVVANNDKQRFSLKYDTSGRLFLRANQGHSLPVNDEQLLTLLTSEQVPPVLFHGTYEKNVKSIEEHGLHRMNRNHIHFSEQLPGKSGTVSKIRRNCDFCVVVDSQKAIEKGIMFYKSENGVVLTSGDSESCVPPSCFKGIWRMSDVEHHVY